VLAVEDELIDDYVRGELSPDQRERFEKFFLKSKERRQKVAFARTLITELAPVLVVPAKAPASSSPMRQLRSRWKSLMDSLITPRPALQLAMRFVLIVGGAWLFWQNRELRMRLAQVQTAEENWTQREQQLQAEATEQHSRGERLVEQLTQEQNRRTQLEQEVATLKSSQPVTDTSFVLFAGVLRSTTETQRLVIFPRIQLVHLQLHFKPESRYPSFSAALQNREGDEIWRQSMLSASTMASGPVVKLSLPATILTPSDYIIKLAGVDATGQIEEISTYAFRVVKR
jgi:hypothetical protein